MRPKERAWLVAGNRMEVEAELSFPQVWPARHHPAVLFMPTDWASNPDLREAAFGWAFSELAEQRGGWLFLVKRLIYFATELGRIASALAAVGMVALFA